MARSIKKSKSVSQGTCALCGSAFSNAAILEHLKECRKRKNLEKTESFHIMVEDRYIPEYWLHLEISQDAKLKALDKYLRDIWLECC
ncbi:MAG: hypothetical protein RDV48_01480 [Candidatus Eremiobacteraeota bacterium]|nr:hypothetical protein [Candidatus Eremiobacteraeota bacterium]